MFELGAFDDDVTRAVRQHGSACASQGCCGHGPPAAPGRSMPQRMSVSELKAVMEAKQRGGT